MYSGCTGAHSNPRTSTGKKVWKENFLSNLPP
jgi:hypothetical protein